MAKASNVVKFGPEALKKRVLRLQDEISNMMLTAAEKAWQIGRALTELKATMAHGEWGAWCRTNLKFSERSVQTFMQIGSLPKLPKSVTADGFIEDDPLRIHDLRAIASQYNRDGGNIDEIAIALIRERREEVADVETRERAPRKPAAPPPEEEAAEVPPSQIDALAEHLNGLLALFESYTPTQLRRGLRARRYNTRPMARLGVNVGKLGK